MDNNDQAVTDESIEQEIHEKGLTAPRITQEHINSVIVSEHYFRPNGTKITVCFLELRNGTIVTGESAPVSSENFDADLGRKIAKKMACDKIWALEGYLLAERIYSGPIGQPEDKAA